MSSILIISWNMSKRFHSPFYNILLFNEIIRTTFSCNVWVKIFLNDVELNEREYFENGKSIMFHFIPKADCVTSFFFLLAIL